MQHQQYLILKKKNLFHIILIFIIKLNQFIIVVMSQHSFQLIADNELRGQQAIIHSIKGFQEGSCIEISQGQHKIFIIYRPNHDANEGTIKIGKALMTANCLNEGVCLVRLYNQPLTSCKTAKMIVNQLDWKIVNSRMGLLQEQFLNQNEMIWPEGKIPLYYTKNDFVVLISKSEGIQKLEQNTQIIIQTQQEKGNTKRQQSQINKIYNLVFFPMKRINNTDQLEQKSLILTLQGRPNLNGYHNSIYVSEAHFDKLKLKKQSSYLVDNCLSVPQSQFADIQLYMNYLKIQQGNQNNEGNIEKEQGLKKRKSNVRFINIIPSPDVPDGHFSCSQLTKKILNLEDIIQLNSTPYEDWKSVTIQMFLKQKDQSIQIKIISDQIKEDKKQFIKMFSQQLIIQHLDSENSEKKRQIIIYPEKPYVFRNNLIYMKLVSEGKNKNSEFSNKPIKLINSFKKDFLRKAIEKEEQIQQIKQLASKIKILKPPLQGYDTQFVELYNLVNQNLKNQSSLWTNFSLRSFCLIYKSQLQAIIKHLTIYMNEKIIENYKQFSIKMLIITSHMNNGKSFLRQVLKEIYQISSWIINFADLALKAQSLSILDLTSYLTSIFLECPFKIIYLDNFDSLCYQIDNGDVHRQNQKILSKLVIRLLKKLSRENNKIIIITSNSLEGIDQEIFNGLGGYHHIILNNPSRELRKSLLSKAQAIRQYQQKEFITEPKMRKNQQKLQSNEQSITFGSLLQTAKGYPPLASRKVQQKKAKFNFSCLAGLEEPKKLIRRTIEKPIKYSELYKKLPIKMPRGLLLYGGTGTGKSAIGAALQDEFHMKFFSVKGSDILSKYIGGSQAAVRDIFQKAMSVAPSIIFFDEFQTIVPRRNSSNTGVTDRVVNQFLCYLDGVASINGVFIVASSSRPDLIDPALLRPGRLDIHIFLDYPNPEQRLQLLKEIYKDSINLKLTDEQYVQYTEGYNYSDLIGLYKELRIKRSAQVFKNMQNPQKEHFKTIQSDFFEQTYKNFKPSTTKAQQQKQKQLFENFRTGKKLDMKNQKTALY